MKVTGKLIDIHQERIYSCEIEIQNGIIQTIREVNYEVDDCYILPGFIDAHVHIESSMLIPTEFARLAVVHGTVATISDPHEIGNVLGVEGVEYMIENGKQSPFKFYFGAPSCVPATVFETAGAMIDVDDIDYLLSKPEVKYLAEMMNWPGVILQDSTVLAKLQMAENHGKPVDGHAPGLIGQQALDYIAAGIYTDHECFKREEALWKLEHGMKVIVREGSAAKNFEELVDLIHDYSDMMMFCSDDKHPDGLVVGHINDLVKRALAKGIDLFKVLQVACKNPVEHYDLEVGLLRENDPADFIVIDNLSDFTILSTFIDGVKVAENGATLLESKEAAIVNNFNIHAVHPNQFRKKATGELVPVIEVIDGQLITKCVDAELISDDGLLQADVERDILKIAVVNRYFNAEPAIGFIQNFGLKSGAIASSVGHDSHNIIVVGVDDASIARAVNLIIAEKGGIAAVSEKEEKIVGLPIAGLMKNGDGYNVAKEYIEIDAMTKEMGSQLISPFMSLSFMALLVIPALKISDLGMFDGVNFQFID